MRAAVIERLVAQRDDQPRYVRHWIRCAVRIGDMDLDAFDVERAGQRTAAADLDAVAKFLDVAGFAEHAVIEFLAARRRPTAIILTVPFTAMSSSSPVIRNEIEPFGWPPLAAR